MQTLKTARIRRTHYWMLFVVLQVSMFVGALRISSSMENPAIPVIALAVAGSLIWTAVCTVRLGDTGESRWIALVTLIPILESWPETPVDLARGYTPGNRG